ncbi:MAG: tetratricopeptide repeat protein [Rhodospirillaceae bacterium]|nr:tetratricopeptide repeat protein [Rhodospirillales bacterium]
MAIRAPASIDRHPWLGRFTAAPEDEFSKLLAGHADIFPYDRADIPDAARSLFGSLAAEDPARAALGQTILAWLERRRRAPFPTDRSALQRALREICEAFEIVSYLEVTDAAVTLRRRFPLWNEWVAPLALSTSRDARAAYWRMLALTQPLIRAAVPLDMTPFWLNLCREAGDRLPSRYLDIGLLGLRRLPEEYAWLAGLAQWAKARQPSEAQFRAEWLALKPLYPKAPKRWRDLVGTLLASAPYQDVGIEAPAWWACDSDFAPLARPEARAAHRPIRSPMPDENQGVIDRFNLPFAQVRRNIISMIDRHRQFARVTGESRFAVRAIHSLGSALIGREGDCFADGCLLAADLAREGLEWQPFDSFLWSLWRDALAMIDAREAAETLGWEAVRRLPDNPRANTELAEMLIAFGRTDAAEEVVEAAFLREVANSNHYSLLARLRDHRGDHIGAMGAVREGLRIYTSDTFLTTLAHTLERGEPLRVLSTEWEKRLLRAVTAEPTSRNDVLRIGRMRRLRAVLEGADQERRQQAIYEVWAALADEPTFAYARLLAIRHGSDPGDAGSLEPPFAIAFERALAAENLEQLEALAKHYPRLEALILVVSALLGDATSVARMADYLLADVPAREERAVTSLRAGLRPLLVAIRDGMAPSEALNDRRALVMAVLRDAVDITLAGECLAA